MKSKVSMIVAVLTLLGGAVLGGWALLSHDDDPSGPAATPTVRTSTSGPDAQPGSTPSAGAKGGTTGGTKGFKIPKGTVDPLKGDSYCETVKLLAIYSHQGYGLNKQLGIVDGQKFATRLKVIAAAYARLSDQAGRNPKAGSAVAPWKALSEATAATEEQLRVAGLQAQSQAMIVKYAELGTKLNVELPRATATLQEACGFSPSVFSR